MNESVPKMKMSASSHHESHAIGSRHTAEGEESLLESYRPGHSGLDELDEDMPSKINDVNACTSSKCLLNNKHPCLESLSKEFSELLHHRDNENHDVEFECEGESIKANGAIVSARSHVIASMITRGQQKIIKIPDMKLEIFKKFLAFLYTESLEELSFDIASDLYVAGRKYAVYSLSTRCSDFLIENLVAYNGLTLVVLADSHGDDAFKEAVVRVMVEERAVFLRKRFAMYPDQYLVSLIKSYLNTKMKTIQQAENYSQALSCQIQLAPHPAQDISLAFDKVKNMMQETDEEIEQMRKIERAYTIQKNEYGERYIEVQDNPELLAEMKQERELLNQTIREKVLPLRIKFIELQQRTFIALSEFLNEVLDTELIRWKQSQLLAGNGAPFDKNTDQRQEWCEDLADIIWENYMQIKLVESVCFYLPLNPPNEMRSKLPLLRSQIISLLSSFVTRLVN